jgi:PhnB protein
MAVKELNPYIHFNGQAEEAIRHYEQALGATLEGPIMRYGEAPMPMPDDYKARVMHSQLRVGGKLLMVSDAPPGRVGHVGGNIDVAIEYTDDAEMARAFDALAAGGTVTMPLGDQFWGGRLGIVDDRFGVTWILLRNPQGGM